VTEESSAPVVVVGAGVIGLCAAFYLCRAGRDVVVVDRAAIGGGSSWGNAGWVCLSHSAPVPAPGVIRHALASIGRPGSPLYIRPQPSLEFSRWMWHFVQSCSPARFEQSYRQLAALVAPAFDRFDELRSAGVETTLSRPGLVHAFLSEDVALRTMATQRRWQSIGYAVPDHPLTGPSVREVDPSLNAEVSAAYVIEGEGVVDPGAFTAAVSSYLAGRGARVLADTPVSEFRTSRGRVSSVQLGGEWLDCSAVVVAAGTWTSDILARLGVHLPLQAGKGYSFSVELPDPPRRPLYLGDKHIVASPIAGRTRLAGTMEFSGNNRHLEWRRIVSIAEASKPYLGEWFERPDDLVGRISEPWVGGRPMLPDGLPLVDRLPNLSNAYVSTGHGMLGVTLAPESGRALSEFLATGARPAGLRPFAIDRLPGVRAA
jgi:glycine/D-amino acid oxidase-like deaminating enzyme